MKLEGKAAHCDVVGDSGNVKTHSFCPACGSPVYLTFAAMPDLFTVHAASLDDPARFKPQAVTYGVRGHAWDHLDPGLPKFDKMPPGPEPAFDSVRVTGWRSGLARKKLSGACRLWRFPIVLKRETPKRRFAMDPSRYRWVIVAAGGIAGLRCDRGDVFAAGAAASHHA